MDPSTRRLLLGGPALVAVGIFTSWGAETSLPGIAVLIGFFAAALGLHRLGRSGPDDAPS